MPDCVGVPLIVMVLANHAAATPAGKPEGAPIPVAPVVTIEISGFKAELIQRVGDEDGVPAVLSGVTVRAPVALTLPHPPVNGMV